MSGGGGGNKTARVDPFTYVQVSPKVKVCNKFCNDIFAKCRLNGKPSPALLPFYSNCTDAVSCCAPIDSTCLSAAVRVGGAGVSVALTALLASALASLLVALRR